MHYVMSHTLDSRLKMIHTFICAITRCHYPVQGQCIQGKTTAFGLSRVCMCVCVHVAIYGTSVYL